MTTMLVVDAMLLLGSLFVFMLYRGGFMPSLVEKASLGWSRLLAILTSLTRDGEEEVDSSSELPGVDFSDDETVEGEHIEDDGLLDRMARKKSRAIKSRTSSLSVNSQDSKVDRHVRFSTIHIRNYPSMPEKDSEVSCAKKPLASEEDPTCDYWSPTQQRHLTIDLYERTKQTTYTRRSHTKRKVSGTPLSSPHKIRRIHRQSRGHTPTKPTTTVSSFLRKRTSLALGSSVQMR